MVSYIVTNVIPVLWSVIIEILANLLNNAVYSTVVAIVDLMNLNSVWNSSFMKFVMLHYEGLNP